MNTRSCKSVASVAMLFFVSPSWAGLLEDLYGRADAVVAGEIQEEIIASGRRDAGVLAVKVFKGEIAPGAQLRIRYEPGSKAGRATIAAVREMGILFLRNEGASWLLLSTNTGALGLRDGYIPVAGSALDAIPVPAKTGSDAVVSYLLGSVEARKEDDRYIRLVLPLLLGSKSPEVSSAVNLWKASAAPNLQIAALVQLIAAGNIDAIEEGARELQSASPRSLSNLLPGSLYAVRSADPRAVRAVGQLAVTPTASLEARQAAAWSLYTVHSKEALPYLFQLLDSADLRIREFAISGFGAFVTGMRIAGNAQDAAWALDEVLNPGRQKKPAAEVPYDTDETRRFVHFGPFKDRAQELEHIAFWKNWYQTKAPQ